VVAFSCKARAVCPSCLGRRMSEGAANLVDHVLPDVPIRQFVLTLPIPLRFPLAFDGKLRQDEVEALVEKLSKRILRFLERRGVITLVTAPGDGEVTVVTDETMAEKDPLLAKLLAAATSGTEAATRRREIRIVLDPDERPVGRGTLCGQSHGFNLQNATRVAANDKDGRERLCRYILRPSLANDRLEILDNGDVRLDFKRPWSDGTSGVVLAPLVLIARLAALVPPPRRHTVLYCGVLSSHAASRKEVVPTPAISQRVPKRKSKYIRWSDLLRRVFGIETICQKCDGRARSARGWQGGVGVPKSRGTTFRYG
jgi:hypothetical protein